MAGRRRRWKIVSVAAFVAAAAVPARPAAVDPPVASPPAPSEARPADVVVPVLLVPGWSRDDGHLVALRGRLLDSGWGDDWVVAVSFRDPVGSNRDHAREIARAALALKARTGVERVDVVAHSMGGLATRYFLQNGGDVHVRRVVFLATPHEGTVSAFFAWGDGAREMQPGSPFLLGLRRAGPVPAGIRALTIRTPLDLHVLPPESATLPGLPDVTVCCPTHAGLLQDAGTFELIERFLTERG